MSVEIVALRCPSCGNADNVPECEARLWRFSLAHSVLIDSVRGRIFPIITFVPHDFVFGCWFL